ncbi:MAG TPA: ribonucleoside triphosphate reductase [Candidatus Acetothermia bacterium]|nr:ribonucleoside triphosphate reductase [Candidatus Acetothermia bacterium]
MIRFVRKRDGRVVPFDPAKITLAITKALQETGEYEPSLPQRLTEKVVKTLESLYVGLFEPPGVEEIQDIVEEVLMQEGLFATARSYIVYRYQHKQMRELKDLIAPSLVDDYLNGIDWRVKENANMTFSLQGLNVFLTEKLISKYWLSRVYPEPVRRAHESGDFHIHDLGTLGPYCVGWDLRDLLLKGFGGVRGKIESKPPKHFRTALLQVANFLYTLQGEAAGAQAFSSLDTYLAPFIAYDGLDYAQVKQAIQEFVFNLNVPTRVGFQTPFTNVTLDIRVPKFMEREQVIIGGKLQKACYGEFQREIAWFNRAFAEIMMEGDARGRPFTFPIPTYNITPDFPWDDPNLDPIWEMTARYGIPYFANFVNSDMKPEDVRSMCCHLRLDNRELRKRGGGLFGAHPLTGSIGVVTINLPRIGYLSRDEAEFLERLGELMELAKKSLIIKRKLLERLTDAGLYPYSRYWLSMVKKTEGEYWHNHFSTIGIIGMNEACLNLFGKNLADPECVRFAERVLDFMREKLADYQEETGHLWNLEATPAEGASYRLALLDKRLFPDILVANEEDVREKGADPYYTNSTQLPVGLTDDVFLALKLQDPLQTKYTGGTVLHIWLGERAEPVAVRALIRAVVENFQLPYFTITPTFSICPNHGYISGEHFQCPECGAQTEVYSRVVGYLRPVDQWNKGKRSEFADRKTFKVRISKEHLGTQSG